MSEYFISSAGAGALLFTFFVLLVILTITFLKGADDDEDE